MTQISLGDDPEESSPSEDPSIEDRFDRVSAALAVELKALSALQQEMKKLAKACSSGDANHLEKALAKIEVMGEEVGRSPAKLREAWGWSATESAEYIRSRLLGDLKSACEKLGLKVTDNFGQNWVALRQLAVTKAGSVRAGKVTLGGHRPSFLAAQLKELSSKSESFSTQQFAEMVASIINVMTSGVGQSVSLRTIWETMTVIPSMRKEYDINMFTADVHRLKMAGGATLSSGLRIEVQGAGGAIRSGTALEVFDEDGRAHHYSSVILVNLLTAEPRSEGEHG